MGPLSIPRFNGLSGVASVDYLEDGGEVFHLTFSQGHIFAYGGFNEETDDPEIVEIPDVPDWPLE